MFLKIAVLKNFPNFTGKHLRWYLQFVTTLQCSKVNLNLKEQTYLVTEGFQGQNFDLYVSHRRNQDSRKDLRWITLQQWSMATSPLSELNKIQGKLIQILNGVPNTILGITNDATLSLGTFHA